MARGSNEDEGTHLGMVTFLFDTAFFADFLLPPMPIEF
jgi:hypothetical protein